MLNLEFLHNSENIKLQPTLNGIIKNHTLLGYKWMKFKKQCFQNQNANKLIFYIQVHNFFLIFKFIIRLHFFGFQRFIWFSGSIFFQAVMNGFPTLLGSRLLLLQYSLWEQSFLQSAENYCLVGGIFTSAWVLLYRAKLKITPQLEVLGLRIWYFQKNRSQYHSLPPPFTTGLLSAFLLCRLEPVSCNKLWCSNFMSQGRVLLITRSRSFLLCINLGRILYFLSSMPFYIDFNLCSMRFIPKLLCAWYSCSSIYMNVRQNSKCKKIASVTMSVREHSRKKKLYQIVWLNSIVGIKLQRWQKSPKSKLMKHPQVWRDNGKECWQSLGARVTLGSGIMAGTAQQ